MKKRLGLLLLLSLPVAALAGWVFLRYLAPGANGGRDARVLTWLRDPQAHPDWAVQAGQRCPQAAFLIPSDGYIGYLWGDSFRPGHHHQGIDIFGGTQPGQTPVLAAYDGYLTRLPDWKSSVIIRIPSDPLQPGRQIWLYYTHMADPNGNSLIADDFPAGTSERFVSAGSLLGYQGNYSGTPSTPVGVHLHFSIVRDDGEGHFLNELQIANTLDPSPYLGIELNAAHQPAEIPLCPPATAPTPAPASLQRLPTPITPTQPTTPAPTTIPQLTNTTALALPGNVPACLLGGACRLQAELPLDLQPASELPAACQTHFLYLPETQLNRVMSADLCALLNQAPAELKIRTIYRSLEQQKYIYKTSSTADTVAEPGTSQHHSGLAIDFCSLENDCRIGLGSGFEDTAAAAWLRAHAAAYGFIEPYADFEQLRRLLNVQESVLQTVTPAAEHHHWLYLGPALSARWQP